MVSVFRSVENYFQIIVVQILQNKNLIFEHQPVGKIFIPAFDSLNITVFW